MNRRLRDAAVRLGAVLDVRPPRVHPSRVAVALRTVRSRTGGGVMEFTPGPWHEASRNNRETWRSIDAPNDEGVCLINVMNRDQDANARLIAAAPEMYGLLLQVGCVCSGGHTRRSPHKGVCAEIRSALAKADGR